MNPSNEDALRAFNQAPSIIQESLSEGKAVDFMESMLSRYSLHVDTVGYVMEFIRNMLLGLLQPDQFIRKLNSVGISDDLARRITADLNKEVFMPLRDEMKRGGAGTHPSAIQAVPAPNITAAPVSKVPPKHETHTTETPAFNLIKKDPLDEVDVVLQPHTQVPPQVSPAALSSKPVIRTMQHDADLVQHGVQATAYPVPMDLGNMPHPSQMTPAQSFQTASVPFTAMPVPAVPVPVSTMPPINAMPSKIVQPTIPKQPSQATNGSSDPYRESI